MRLHLHYTRVNSDVLLALWGLGMDPPRGLRLVHR